ncbi:rab proteins geranylgeranyltransferase component [Plasmopara halstedii]|uniref:Rab proteins geranylgeranyltransferase component n=1 Tax=Plasmopara halstedii TaxID=4781 RepID=A0A0P1B0W5_PLAHL|nr:rab proteins geranylgeranyltransferase component [Plasmopara halstedii]CEG46877.1 rab proteins geranylgeranyltransferase component [Plasmopara halstedii]|eukprot:XP_024583246.1 rab proteins geranylgeranyltransferase component [Plasmopara halstedii]
MDPSLSEREYDVVVVGTGMVEGILAGALARIGKKVLHLDQNDYYGSNYASFPLAQFRRWTKNEVIAPREEDDEKSGQVASKSIGPLDDTIHQVIPMQHSFQCQLLQECFVDNATKTKLLGQSSAFSIDVNPRLLLSSEQLVETLITSGVGRYLEFAAIERTYVHLPTLDNSESDTVWHVPCSKTDVFQSKLLGMVEKRQLMKFLQFVADYGDTHILHEDIKTKNERSLALGRALKRPQNKLSQVDDEVALASYLEMSFHDFLAQYFHLSNKLQQIIVYCVGLATFSATNQQLSARDGLVAVYRYVASIGRFAGTAFLTPLYGISELAQSFCRLSAVYGGVYVLRAPIDAFVLNLETKSVCGVRATDGNICRAKHIVANGSYATSLYPSGMSGRGHGKVLRGIFLLRNSLRHGVNRLMLVIPPDDQEFHNPFAIQVIQLDAGVYACPKGYVLVHVSTPWSPEWVHESEKELKLMQLVIRRLILSSKAEKQTSSQLATSEENNWNPEIAWHVIFTVDHLTFGPSTGKLQSTHLPSNIYVCETSFERYESGYTVNPLELHLENASANARAIFEAMCPGEPFLPKSASAEQAELEEQECEEEVVLRAAQELVQKTQGIEESSDLSNIEHVLETIVVDEKDDVTADGVEMVCTKDHLNECNEE